MFGASQGQNQGQWNMAVAQVAQQLGLRHQPIENHWHSARGQLGKLDVDISIDTEWAGDNTFEVMKIEVDLETDGSLVIKRRGMALEDDDGAGEPMQLGDPQFDQLVELRSVPGAVLEALRAQAELRNLIASVVGQWGGYVLDGELIVKSQQFPTAAEHLMAYVQPMAELGRWISEPAAPRAHSALGTAASASMGQLSQMPEPQKLQHIHGFLTQLGANIGQGQAFIKANDNEVEWRGSANNYPVRIKVDAFPDVEIECKVQHGHGSLELEYDQEKIPEQGAPPPWDESDVQRIFVGRGVFMERTSYDVDAHLGTYNGLDKQCTTAISEAIQREDIRYFRIGPGGIHVYFRPNLSEMLDPEGQIVRVALLLGWVGQWLSGTSPPEPAVGPQGHVMAVHKITCAYCNTMFPFSAQPFCPNCGAPAQG
jgi:hypothetical protein